MLICCSVIFCPSYEISFPMKVDIATWTSLLDNPFNYVSYCRSLTLPPPKEETLSRHSILGPNGLRGPWQPPTSDKGV